MGGVRSASGLRSPLSQFSFTDTHSMSSSSPPRTSLADEFLAANAKITARLAAESDGAR